MDGLQAMGAFVAVVDTGGFAGAARKLGLSAPAVTRAVADLEARLGLRLLTRTTRHVRVTAAGARYAEDCRRILSEIEDSEAAASGAGQAARGTLTVTAPVLFGHLYVTPLLTRYLAQNPEVDATCLFLDRVVNLMEEGVDVALRIGELPDSSLLAARVGQPQVQKLQPRLRTITNDSAIATTLSGFGLTRLLGYQAAEHLRSGALQVVLQGHEPPPQPIHVLHLEGRRATQKVRGFIDLAVAALRADPALR